MQNWICVNVGVMGLFTSQMLANGYDKSLLMLLILLQMLHCHHRDGQTISQRTCPPYLYLGSVLSSNCVALHAASVRRTLPLSTAHMAVGLTAAGSLPRLRPHPIQHAFGPLLLRRHCRWVCCSCEAFQRAQRSRSRPQHVPWAHHCMFPGCQRLHMCQQARNPRHMK